ncbi:deoxyribodipyrimidine photo-lyase [Sporocytophaga myxococcoides]|uniref:deoxyribodipyrimidine photo-lyase n=1 Tax=Sporocytophaga myxococcoides TaxID=153721 RepID=UPI000415C772|nr:deoxyribodipyrimidine photo-lyase [Sporocytophaga myxococcoides]
MKRIKVEKERVKLLNDKPVSEKGKYVLYWMQQSQRVDYNHALEYAALKANELELPLLVVFGLMDDYPEANLRHYHFMLEGLKDTASLLSKRRIKFILKKGNPPEVAQEFAIDAALVFCDMGYLRHQRIWRKQLSESAFCRVVQVESDAVVPVEIASAKAEFAARTIRRKIWLHASLFIVPLDKVELKHSSLDLNFKNALSLNNIDLLLASLKLDTSIGKVDQFFKGGPTEAKKRLTHFIVKKLALYVKNRNQPYTDDISHMSMYLHFGQISPVEILLEIQKNKSRNENADSYVEELLIRRELSINFVYYTFDYDRYSFLPEWAKNTLEKHKADERPHRYTLKQLEASKTHDPYWNAAMDEMRVTGFMHNYMRMYWGKKILEWSDTPEKAYKNLVFLNNKYFLDGRDPASYANIGWIFGLHDRPWGERAIYGTVRTMVASGLERKTNPKAYVEKVNLLKEKAQKKED